MPGFVERVADDEREVAERDVALQSVGHGRGPPFEDFLHLRADVEAKSWRRVLRVLGLGDEGRQVGHQLQKGSKLSFKIKRSKRHKRGKTILIRFGGRLPTPFTPAFSKAGS